MTTFRSTPDPLKVNYFDRHMSTWKSSKIFMQQTQTNISWKLLFVPQNIQQHRTRLDLVLFRPFFVFIRSKANVHSHPIIRMENFSRIAWPILTHVRLCFVIHRTLNPRNLYSMFEHCGCHNSRPSVDENRRNGTSEITRLAALMQELLTKSFRVSLQRNAFCLTT